MELLKSQLWQYEFRWIPIQMLNSLPFPWFGEVGQFSRLTKITELGIPMVDIWKNLQGVPARLCFCCMFLGAEKSRKCFFLLVDLKRWPCFLFHPDEFIFRFPWLPTKATWCAHPLFGKSVQPCAHALEELKQCPPWMLCLMAVAFSQNLHDSLHCNQEVSFTLGAIYFSVVEGCCVLISVIDDHIASLLNLTSTDGSPIYMLVCGPELVIDGFLQDSVSSCLSFSGSDKYQWTIAWSVNGECSETGSYWVSHVVAWYMCCTGRITWAFFLLDNMKHYNRQKLLQTPIPTLPVVLVVIGDELQSQPSTRQFVKLSRGSTQDKGLFLVVPMVDLCSTNMSSWNYPLSSSTLEF